MPIDKYDKEGEKIVQHWLEQLTGEKFNEPFLTALQNGVILCKAANAIKPGIIPTYHEGKEDYNAYRSNVLKFLRFCHDCRVPDYDLFQPENILNRTDITSVIQCLLCLGRQVPMTFKEFKGPHMVSDVTSIQTATEAEKARQVLGLMTYQLPTKSNTPVKGAAPNNNKGKGQTEVIQGNWNKTLRQKLHKISEDANDKKSSLGKKYTNKPTLPSNRNGGKAGIKTSPDIHYDKDAEKHVLDWIQTLTEESDTSSSLESLLKNGVVLLKIANALVPNTFNNIRPSNIAFRQMDKISKFRRFLMKLGLKEYDVFHVTDIYEGSDIGAVIRTFITLGKQLKLLLPDYQGPELLWDRSGPVAYY